DAEVTDEALVAQFGEGGEVSGDRAGAAAGRDAQVDDVEVVAAERAEVLLDLAAQLGGGGPVPLAGRVPAGPDLGGDHQVVRVRRQGPPDQLVGREVERGGVDVIDAEIDRAAEHLDGAAGLFAEPHRAEAHAAHGQVTQPPGACLGRVGREWPRVANLGDRSAVAVVTLRGAVRRPAGG